LRAPSHHCLENVEVYQAEHAFIVNKKVYIKVVPLKKMTKKKINQGLIKF